MQEQPFIYIVVKEILCFITRILVGAYAFGKKQDNVQQSIFFANHTSHLDTLVLLSSLPYAYRKITRPVAAADYWNKGIIRKWIATKVLNVVLIDRHSRSPNILESIEKSLQEGYSIILFPEGTRKEQEIPSDFKAGLFVLAEKFPHVILKPVYLENLHRILPKGTILFLPLINRVYYSDDMPRVDNETKKDFLIRARQSVIEHKEEQDE